MAPQDPEAQPLGPRVTADGLLGWLGSERVQSGLNAKQLELLRVVVERVLVELELVPPDHEIALRRAEPLAWLLHGPPGTGKSHVLKFLRELFEEQLGYAQGVDYEARASSGSLLCRGRFAKSFCGRWRRSRPSTRPTFAGGPSTTPAAWASMRRRWTAP